MKKVLRRQADNVVSSGRPRGENPCGAFQSFTRRIEGINRARLPLKVMAEIFGRTHPLKLKFSEVEEIDFTPERSTTSDS
jgi:hypothetical protein